MSEEVPADDDGWRIKLSPMQFHVLREAGTEPPFTGSYWDNKTPGTYRCAGCATVLFRSDEKYDSGCGWPSFTHAHEEGRVTELLDRSHGMVRMEVRCASCSGHLGHVFRDGPPPRHTRYCINSAALTFEPD